MLRIVELNRCLYTFHHRLVVSRTGDSSAEGTALSSKHRVVINNMDPVQSACEEAMKHSERRLMESWMLNAPSHASMGGK